MNTLFIRNLDSTENGTISSNTAEEEDFFEYEGAVLHDGLHVSVIFLIVTDFTTFYLLVTHFASL